MANRMKEVRGEDKGLEESENVHKAIRHVAAKLL